MKKKSILRFFVSCVLVLASLPAIHLLLTKWSEDSFLDAVAIGYANDASGLNQTPIAEIIDVPNNKHAIIQQLSKLIRTATTNQQKISIAGAKHSMGGHTMYPDGIVLNMLSYNHISLNKEKNILSVGAGALWSDIIKYLDEHDKSVAVMQALSSFSVGGSISVNGHGWQTESPPIASSVIAFTLMNHKGEIVTCSRDENTELFRLVIGGYGLFGVILDVELRVVDNVALEYKNFVFPSNQYPDYYKKYVTNNAKVNLVYGRLDVTGNNFLNEATLNIYEKTADNPPAFDAFKTSEIQRLVLRASVDSEYGKRQRWLLEKMSMAWQKGRVFSRNQLLDNDVKYIANQHSDSTDILHEYFIPEAGFSHYIKDVKPILQRAEIDLLNITIRAVNKDEDSFMRYANQDVFGFVYLFNQKKTETQEKQMQLLTQQLVEIAGKHQGTYYLPYRLHIGREKMREIYPQADDFFKLKRKYDPDELFNNQFYLHYKPL